MKNERTSVGSAGGVFVHLIILGKRGYVRIQKKYRGVLSTYTKMSEGGYVCGVFCPYTIKITPVEHSATIKQGNKTQIQESLMSFYCQHGYQSDLKNKGLKINKNIKINIKSHKRR